MNIVDTQKKPIIIVLGPTAVGKTDFVNNLTIILNNAVEIINGDMGQMYTPFSIGTAKPDIDKETVPHHLFNIIDKPLDFTSALYREKVEKLIKRIYQNKKIPIIVGGSNFYLESLFFKLPVIKINSDFNFDSFTTEDLWQKLFQIDSVRANSISICDRYRIERALNIWHSTGVKPSDCKPIFSPLAKSLIIFLYRDKNELHERINLRTTKMLQSGFIDEVSNLNEDWRNFLLQKKLIGYPEIINYLNKATHKPLSLADLEPNLDKYSIYNLEQEISQKTRAYAKRQLTFYKRFKKNIIESDVNKQVKFEEINLTNINQIDLLNLGYNL